MITIRLAGGGVKQYPSVKLAHGVHLLKSETDDNNFGGGWTIGVEYYQMVVPLIYPKLPDAKAGALLFIERFKSNLHKDGTLKIPKIMQNGNTVIDSSVFFPVLREMVALGGCIPCRFDEWTTFEREAQTIKDLLKKEAQNV